MLPTSVKYCRGFSGFVALHLDIFSSFGGNLAVPSRGFDRELLLVIID